MSKCTVKTFWGVENWFIFIYVLCYKFWFSRPASNVLSPVFNWASWVEWVTQGQELKISLWNWLHWIQCLQIGLRDIISYFYYQMLFLEAILLSTLSKMSNYSQNLNFFPGVPSYWIQHSWFMLKCLVSKLYSKLPLTSYFWGFPTSL